MSLLRIQSQTNVEAEPQTSTNLNATQTEQGNEIDLEKLEAAAANFNKILQDWRTFGDNLDTTADNMVELRDTLAAQEHPSQEGPPADQFGDIGSYGEEMATWGNENEREILPNIPPANAEPNQAQTREKPTQSPPKEPVKDRKPKPKAPEAEARESAPKKSRLAPAVKDVPVEELKPTEQGPKFKWTPDSFRQFYDFKGRRPDTRESFEGKSFEEMGKCIGYNLRDFQKAGLPAFGQANSRELGIVPAALKHHGKANEATAKLLLALSPSAEDIKAMQNGNTTAWIAKSNLSRKDDETMVTALETLQTVSTLAFEKAGLGENATEEEKLKAIKDYLAEANRQPFYQVSLGVVGFLEAYQKHANRNENYPTPTTFYQELYKGDSKAVDTILKARQWELKKDPSVPRPDTQYIDGKAPQKKGFEKKEGKQTQAERTTDDLSAAQEQDSAAQEQEAVNPNFANPNLNAASQTAGVGASTSNSSSNSNGFGNAGRSLGALAAATAHNLKQGGKGLVEGFKDKRRAFEEEQENLELVKAQEEKATTPAPKDLEKTLEQQKAQGGGVGGTKQSAEEDVQLEQKPKKPLEPYNHRSIEPLPENTSLDNRTMFLKGWLAAQEVEYDKEGPAPSAMKVEAKIFGTEQMAGVMGNQNEVSEVMRATGLDKNAERMSAFNNLSPDELRKLDALTDRAHEREKRLKAEKERDIGPNSSNTAPSAPLAKGKENSSENLATPADTVQEEKAQLSDDEQVLEKRNKELIELPNNTAMNRALQGENSYETQKERVAKSEQAQESEPLKVAKKIDEHVGVNKEKGDAGKAIREAMQKLAESLKALFARMVGSRKDNGPSNG